MTAAEQRTYEKYLENRSSLDCVIYTAKMDGIAEGRAEGEAKGRAEVAGKMKAKGFGTGDIAEATGLSPEEIEKL